jgi:hypothetical protein
MSHHRPNLTVVAGPRGRITARSGGRRSDAPPPVGHGHGPWVYDRYFDLLLHPTFDCETCHRWFTHYDIHLTRDELSLLEARRVHDEILEQTAKAASKAKDQEIVALRQKLEEVQRELEEARQGNVSLRRRRVLGRLLTIPCSASPSQRTTLSLTRPARASTHAAAHPCHPLNNQSYPHQWWPFQPAHLQVHRVSRES